MPTAARLILPPSTCARSARSCDRIDPAAVDELAHALADVRRGQGRLFILGVGGGAGHASHAVNDFRKLCDFESYAPTDNVSELTARTNDEGWETSFDAWLRTSRLVVARRGARLLGRGRLARAQRLGEPRARASSSRARSARAIFGVVGSADGATARGGRRRASSIDAPPERRTPHVEAFQAVVWHLLVSHPELATAAREVGVGRGSRRS